MRLMQNCNNGKKFQPWAKSNGLEEKQAKECACWVRYHNCKQIRLWDHNWGKNANWATWLNRCKHGCMILHRDLWSKNISISILHSYTSLNWTLIELILTSLKRLNNFCHNGKIWLNFRMLQSTNLFRKFKKSMKCVNS